MKLYGFFRSSAAFRVRIALGLKRLTADQIPVHLRKDHQRAPDYLALNPLGLVPTLIEDDGTALAQSLAIVEYLDETRPEPPLLPREPKARAHVRALAQVVACEIHPLNNLRVLNYLRRDLKQPETAVEAWYAHWIATGFEAFEAMLDRRPGRGRFCLDDAPGLADICLVPQVFNAKRYPIPLSPYPKLMAVFEACMKLPAFDAAQPSKQPDFEP
ncbi:MAG: maleylacetoacetate isomerase [Alphaproteobacteria bacterium]|nr:maleylacetoacetate isomerase [Alphaproteobacteria bacterium]